MIIILKNIKGNKKIWKFLNHGQLGSNQVLVHLNYWFEYSTT